MNWLDPDEKVLLLRALKVAEAAYAEYGNHLQADKFANLHRKLGSNIDQGEDDDAQRIRDIANGMCPKEIHNEEGVFDCSKRAGHKGAC